MSAILPTGCWLGKKLLSNFIEKKICIFHLILSSFKSNTIFFHIYSFSYKGNIILLVLFFLVFIFILFLYCIIALIFSSTNKTVWFAINVKVMIQTSMNVKVMIQTGYDLQKYLCITGASNLLKTFVKPRSLHCFLHKIIWLLNSNHWQHDVS